MTRRALFALFALLANAKIPQAQKLSREPGPLAIDLDQFSMIVIRHGGHEIELPPKILFEELFK